MKKEWEYYNHALIPTLAPHEVPDTSWMKDGKRWRELADGKYPLFARWTTEFDCEEETEWWYIIKDAPFILEDLTKHSQKHIRQALRKCSVGKCVIKDSLEDLYRVYTEACDRYQLSAAPMDFGDFKNDYCNFGPEYECWCGYDCENRMVGYLVIAVKTDYVETSIAKFSSQYMNLRVSDALYYTVLDYYLNTCQKKYVSSGERSINHITNIQEYKISTFGFRKAYCVLHIRYRKPIQFFINCLFPIRCALKQFDKIRTIHLLNCMLLQEEIHREFKVY